MSRQTILIIGLLFMAVGLVFGQTVHYGFINADDDECVFENPHVTHGLTWPAVGWALTNQLVGNWDPLTWISHLVDWQLYGRDAGGHHFTNVLLHAATVVLLFFVLRQMTGQAWPSALAAALWAVHPLRVESVAWVTERKDVLSGLFFVLTLAAYTSYVRHRFSLVRYIGVMVCFALGLMSKPMLVTMPFVLLLMDYWPLGRVACRVRARTDAQNPESATAFLVRTSAHPTPLWFLVLEKVPLLVMVVLCCAVTVWAQRVPEIQYGSLWWRIGDSLLSYIVYLRQCFWPADLAMLYPHRGPDLSRWQVFGAGLALFGITAALWAARRRGPYLLVGWLWFLGMLVPVIGLVPFGGQMAADRFTYLPQIGLSIGLVWAVADWCGARPHRRWACSAVSALALATLLVCTWRQTSYWRDSQTLWTRSLSCTSGNYRVHNLLGNALALSGRTEDAVVEFRKALAIKPDHPEAHYSLGVAAASRPGGMDEAIEHYRAAIKARPGFAIAHNNLGNALLLRGQLQEAAEHFLIAIKVRPEFAEAHFNLGNILLMLDRSGEAMTEYEKALEYQPDHAAAHYNLGLILEARGRKHDALLHYRKAQELAEAQARQEKASRAKPSP